MSLKLVEVLVLVCAGAIFVWWQMRDLRIAREQTRQQRLAEQVAREAQGGSANSANAPDQSSPDGAPHAR